MKLTTEMAGERGTLELKREGARVVAVLDGRAYEVEAREPEPGVYLLTFEGRVYECHVGDAAGDVRRQQDDAREVRIGGHAYTVALGDPKRLRHVSSGSGADAGGRAEIKASMPGKVVRVLVEAGAQVEAGDGLVVIEAMKMQNELKSPIKGTVIEIHARAGDTVNAGDALVVVE